MLQFSILNFLITVVLERTNEEIKQPLNVDERGKAKNFIKNFTYLKKENQSMQVSSSGKLIKFMKKLILLIKESSDTSWQFNVYTLETQSKLQIA